MDGKNANANANADNPFFKISLRFLRLYSLRVDACFVAMTNQGFFSRRRDWTVIEAVRAEQSHPEATCKKCCCQESQAAKDLPRDQHNKQITTQKVTLIYIFRSLSKVNRGFWPRDFAVDRQDKDYSGSELGTAARNISIISSASIVLISNLDGYSRQQQQQQQ